MTHPHTIDRAAAEAKGYHTTTAAEFELAEFIRYVVGDHQKTGRTIRPVMRRLWLRWALPWRKVRKVRKVRAKGKT